MSKILVKETRGQRYYRRNKGKAKLAVKHWEEEHSYLCGLYDAINRDRHKQELQIHQKDYYRANAEQIKGKVAKYRCQCQDTSLLTANNYGLLWDSDEIEILKAQASRDTVLEIATTLGRSFQSVRYKAYSLGIKFHKPLKYAEAIKERIRNEMV